MTKEVKGKKEREKSHVTQILKKPTINIICTLGFPLDLVTKNLPAMWETWVQSLGQADPLEKETATRSKCSCLRSRMDRRNGQATDYGVTKESDMTQGLNTNNKYAQQLRHKTV